MPGELVFYTRPDCPLCDKSWPIAEALAVRRGLRLRQVNIETDSHLEARHGHRIPVIELDGVVLGWGRLSERALARTLTQMLD